MKKLISLCFLVAFSLTTLAQSTSPRFGTTAREDNTYRVLTLDYKATTTTTATAVLYQKPKSFHTIYKIGTLTHALTDSLSTTNAYLGDEVVFIFNADTLTAGRVVTFGNNMRSAGTLTVPNSKSSHSGEATATFVFDGVFWTEKCRALNTN